MDGRDIGTVICPEATAKLYVDARPELRARRRWTGAEGHGDRAGTRQALLAELNARDAADKSRPIAPLKQAPDADLLDTSDLGIDAAFAAALALVSPKDRGRAQGPPQGLRRPGGFRASRLLILETQLAPHAPAWEVRRLTAGSA